MIELQVLDADGVPVTGVLLPDSAVIEDGPTLVLYAGDRAYRRIELREGWKIEDRGAREGP